MDVTDYVLGGGALGCGWLAWVIFEGTAFLDVDALWAIPLAIIALILGGLCIRRIVKRFEQRSKKFKDLAEQMGMEFSEEGDSALRESLSVFDLFDKKMLQSGQFTNVLHGDSEQLGYGEEFEVRILDCWYKEGRQHRRVSSQTMICFHSPQLSLPQFSLRPEGLHQKIGSALGYQDIDFESHQTGAEFSKKYLLRGKDEQWMTEEKIRVLFTDKILTFFAAHPDKVFVGGSGDQLIFYREGNLIEPENTPAFIEEGLEVFRLFASSQPS